MALVGSTDRSGTLVRGVLSPLLIAALVLAPGCRRRPLPLPPLTGRAASALTLYAPQIRPNEWATFNGYLQGALDHVQRTGRPIELPEPRTPMTPRERCKDLTRRILAVAGEKLGSTSKGDVLAAHALDAAMHEVDSARQASRRPSPGGGARVPGGPGD